jgi:hypothetical protein
MTASVVYDIQKMVERLYRADISFDHLAYELDEHDWQKFTRYLEGLASWRESDTSYLEECIYMGLHIRKRTPANRQGVK